MGEARFAGRGKFVWYDMMSTDPKRSLEFYSALFGWSHTDELIEGMGNYTMLRAGDREIGGIVPFDPSAGMPSHWMPYLTVDDVDEAAARIPSLAGSVCVPPCDIPGIGRFAVIGDSTGAYVSIFRSNEAGEVEEPGANMFPGGFCWMELLTDDNEKAYAFYRDLVGWGRDDMDMGPMGNYLIVKAGENPVGGMMNKPPEAEAPSFWLPYIGAEDVDASASKAQQLGAAICVAPQDIPGVGRFAVLNDPLGATFALFRGSEA